MPVVPLGGLHVPVLEPFLQLPRRADPAAISLCAGRGKIGEESISGHTVALVLKRYAKKAGLQVDEFSGHSLRASFVTSAADCGAHINRIMDVWRHVDPRTVRTYIRRADRFKDHAGSGFL